MSLRRPRAVHVALASLVVLAFHEPSMLFAQQKPAAPLPGSGDALMTSRWALPHIDTSPPVPGRSIRISREAVTQIGESVIRRTGPDRRGLQHFDAVRNSASVARTPAEGFRQSSAVSVKGPVGPGRTSLPDNGSDSWIGTRTSWVTAPLMVYPDDVVLTRDSPRVYAERLDRTFRAGKDAGRRETLFRGQLDMYNERMGNPPSGRLPSDSGYGPFGLTGPYYDPNVTDAYATGKRAGEYEGEYWLARDRHLIQTARASVEKGLLLFESGQYGKAADMFRLAAASDHGDAAARILAGHAYFATGRYNHAFSYIRRAFQLQPKIAMLTYDLRRDYGNLDDFTRHLDALKAKVEQDPRNYELCALLGYIQRYSGDREAAIRSLSRAYEMEPRDRLIRDMLDIDPSPQK